MFCERERALEDDLLGCNVAEGALVFGGFQSWFSNLGKGIAGRGFQKILYAIVFIVV